MQAFTVAFTVLPETDDLPVPAMVREPRSLSVVHTEKALPHGWELPSRAASKTTRSEVPATSARYGAGLFVPVAFRTLRSVNIGAGRTPSVSASRLPLASLWVSVTVSLSPTARSSRSTSSPLWAPIAAWAGCW